MSVFLIGGKDTLPISSPEAAALTLEAESTEVVLRLERLEGPQFAGQQHLRKVSDGKSRCVWLFCLFVGIALRSSDLSSP